MAFLGETFVVAELPEAATYELIPAGWYQATVATCELKPTRDGSGKIISMKLDILGPTHQGRCIYHNLNLINKSEVAQEIGRRELGIIATANGLASVADSDELIGATLKIKVGTEPATEQYQAKSVIKSLATMDAGPELGLVGVAGGALKPAAPFGGAGAVAKPTAPFGGAVAVAKPAAQIKKTPPWAVKKQ